MTDGDEVATENTCSRMMSVINKIQQTVDGDSIQTAFASMEADAQQALVAAMQ